MNEEYAEAEQYYGHATTEHAHGVDGLAQIANN
jgi:hypothetical protein